jgi:hypothetical protein
VKSERRRPAVGLRKRVEDGRRKGEGSGAQIQKSFSFSYSYSFSRMEDRGLRIEDKGANAGQNANREKSPEENE